MKLIRLLLLALVFVIGSVDVSVAQWEKAAGPEGATVTSIVKHGAAIYMTAGNTVYKSTDGGTTWVSKRNGIPEIADISVMSANDDVLFVGANDSGSGDKIFVSADGGDNWTATGGLGAIILAFDWAAKDSTIFMISNFGKLYRSTDDGATFTDLGPFGAGSKVHVLGDSVYVTGRGSVKRSVDNGDTFTENIGTGGGPTFGFLQIGSAAMFNGDLIIGTAGAFMLNGSDEWVASSTGFPTNIAAQPDLNITELVVIGPNLWAITTKGLFFTADISAGWTAAPNGPPGVEGLSAELDGNTLYVGTTGAGIFKADDATNTSAALNAMNSGLLHATVNGLVTDGADLLVFGLGFGVVKTADNGDTFMSLNGDIPSTAITAFTKIGNRLIAVVGITGTYVSDDDGQTWVLEGDAPLGIHSIGNDGTTILAGAGSAIFKSSDNGDTWAMVTAQNQLGTTQTRSFAFHANAILAGLTGNGVARSTDGGDTWAIIGNAEGLGGIFDKSEVVIFQGDDAYATFAPLFGAGGIRKSTDFGATWAASNTGLPEAFGSTVPTVDMVALPDGKILVRTTVGMSESTDDGANWTDFDITNFPISNISGKLHAFGSNIFYGSSGQSLFRTGSGVPVSTEDPGNTIPSTITLNQNYPNPFNPTTNISFTLPQASEVSLKVYNVLGQEVATVLNQRVNAGTFTATFDASGLASGIYLYRLVANGGALVRRMTLIK